MADIINISLLYDVSASVSATYSMSTLGVLPMGLPTLSVVYEGAPADTYVNVLHGIHANSEAISRSYVSATPIRLLTLMYSNASHNTLEALCLRNGRPCIRVPNWVYTMTDGTFGRIHIPTDPYM